MEFEIIYTYLNDSESSSS